MKQENKIKKLKKNNVIKGSSIKLLNLSKDDSDFGNALLVNKKQILQEQQSPIQMRKDQIPVVNKSKL